MTMTPIEALEKAVRVLGSQTALAFAAGEGVETAHVYHWLKKSHGRGVPAKYCPRIEGATREKAEKHGDPSLIVLCDELCPDVAWNILRGSAPAICAPIEA